MGVGDALRDFLLGDLLHRPVQGRVNFQIAFV